MDKIIINNKKEVERKIRIIKENGAEKLHIISDFDMTLTKPRGKGQRANGSYDLLNEGGYLKEGFMEKAHELYDFYRPIETSTELTREEIAVKMDEWLDKYYSLLMKSGLKKEHFMDIIKKDKVVLRDNANEFMRIALKKKIPLLILSAGLGDLISEYLNYKKENYSNIYIVSNFLNFDEEGNAISHSKNLITAFNKNEAGIKKTAYYNQINERKNVILLGDTIGDANMDSGLQHDIILKIGFLNGEGERQEETHSLHYDVVIVNGTFQFVNEIINDLK